jgi:tRNA-splicing ligase RtcB (3'-phosphate/5'-hydroxy nucleic acid ligase)
VRVETERRTPIKLWTTSSQGDVPVEEKALAQLRNIASLPFVFRHVAAMPDVHRNRSPGSSEDRPESARGSQA